MWKVPMEDHRRVGTVGAWQGMVTVSCFSGRRRTPTSS